MNRTGSNRILALALALCVMLTLLPDVSIAAFAASDPQTYTFDISEGDIKIEPGASQNTLKVAYGVSQIEDNILGTQEITLTGSSTANRITVSGTCNVTLDNVDIDVSATGNYTGAISLQTGANVTLNLEGNNILTGAGPGLEVPEGTTLTIEAADAGQTLTAKGGMTAAGIGGDQDFSGGTITINGGTVNTVGQNGGAGIGSGRKASAGPVTGGIITINGGIVEASCQQGNAIGTGQIIGTGATDAGTNITINGGSVKASSLSSTPTNGNGNTVYFGTLSNQPGVTSLSVDEVPFWIDGNHNGDNSLYLYMTGENHIVDVEIGGVVTSYTATWTNPGFSWDGGTGQGGMVPTSVVPGLSPNPATYGTNSVTVTVAVTDSSLGTRSLNIVNFYLDSAAKPFASSPVISGTATATLDASNLSIGNYQIKAAYGGSFGGAASIGTETLSICDIPTVGTITAPATVTDGSVLTLTDPIVTHNNAAITSEGWEISADGNTGWRVFNAASPVTITDNGKYLRYYATNSAGRGYSPNIVQVTVLSSEKEIMTFTIPGQVGSTTIGTSTISLTMPYGTGLTALVPNITVSNDASVSPVSGVVQDFTNPVTYTVTAQDNTQKTYTVTVTNAAPDAHGITVTADPMAGGSPTASQTSATDGTVVTLSANPNTDYDFVRWEVTSPVALTLSSDTDPAANFTMPDEAVAIIAHYSYNPPVLSTYTVSVNDSYATTTGTDSYQVGDTVTIDAGNRSNYHFTGWTTSSGGVSIADAGSKRTTFQMPANNVIVTANWRYEGSGGGSSRTSNSGESTSNGNIKVYGVNVPYTLDSKTNIFTLDLTSLKLDEIIKAAGDSKTITISIDNQLNFKELEINFPSAWFAQHTDIATPVQSGIGGITLSGNLAKQFPAQDKTATVSLKAGSLIFSAKQNSKAVTWSSEKVPTVVSMPYTLKSNEDENAVVLYDKANGKNIVHSFYSEGKVYAAVPGTGTYEVKVIAVGLTDTANHWAKDDVAFVTTHGLISATEGKFSPDTAIIRADFLMALGKLSGADVSGYTISSFTDVAKDNPAMPYIEWAVENNIVQGIGNQQFGPNQLVTREQMAVMMTAYAKATGQVLPKLRAANTFADSNTVSSWAGDAVKAIQQAGIISGKGDNRFDPQSSASRAEASAILLRFAKNTINGEKS